MDASCLFTDALQLQEPWKVGSVDFRDAGDGGREPRVAIVFGPGARFHCHETGCPETACPVHDTRERVWRHPDFFRYKAFVHAAMPRVTCPVHGARTAPAPWARPGSGFTLLFGAWAVETAHACRRARSPGGWTRPTPDCGGSSRITWTRRGARVCFVKLRSAFGGGAFFVGLIVGSITTDHATRPSSRRRSMMLMPNSVLMRLSRYQTM